MTATTPPILEARDLIVGHDSKAIVGPVDLDIHLARVCVVLGPNGGSKTTLFRTLLGHLPPLAGSVRIAGRPVAQISRSELARLIAYVPQQQSPQLAYTLADLVLMGRASRVGLFGQPSPHDRDVAMQCLTQMGIAHLAGRSQLEVSGGERQLALIARALAQQAQLLVMDEPTASLDFGNQLRVLDRIRSLRDAGLCVLMTTHQPEHALQVADELILLKRGALQGPLAAGTLCAHDLAELYGVGSDRITQAIPSLAPAGRPHADTPAPAPENLHST